MPPISATEAIGWGLVGGFLATVFEIYSLRFTPKDRRPAWLKSPWYWWMNAIRVVLGGLVVFAYIRDGQTPKGVFECLYLGASAPLILKGIFGGKSIEPGKTDEDESDLSKPRAV